MDFPSQPDADLPLHIHTHLSAYSVAQEAMMVVTATVGSYDWPAVDRAIFVPFAIPWPYPVARMFWVNGTTATGNMDCGIYALDGQRIVSTGEVAQSGASTPQYADVTDFMLPAGSYYLALANDSATTTARGFGMSAVTAEVGRVAGMRQMASASPLPATATFAQFASAGLPLCGFTRTASGF